MKIIKLGVNDKVLIQSENIEDVNEKKQESVPPKVKKEEKGYLGLYLPTELINRFNEFIQDQIQAQGLPKRAKINSHYAEIALDDYLRKYGYIKKPDQR